MHSSARHQVFRHAGSDSRHTQPDRWIDNKVIDKLDQREGKRGSSAEKASSGAREDLSMRDMAKINGSGLVT